MRTSRCVCDATLFFGNRQCLRCGRTVVRCPVCERTAAVDGAGSGHLICHGPGCGAELRLCENASAYSICNGAVAADSDHSRCRYCGLNAVIPSLQVPGNLEKWSSLETAKHRVLAGFEAAGFRLSDAAVDDAPPLRFEFKEDGEEVVTTGHWQGVITIKLAEADSVFRERARVSFGESKRTLADHFRHELGHYVWDWRVDPHRLDAFRGLFGDERNPTYADAQDQYYNGGPPDDWPQRTITRYASMHPWEDFAETFRIYLEQHDTLWTAVDFGLVPRPPETFEDRFTASCDLGLALTELSRDLGVGDMFSANLPGPVVRKLAFIDGLSSAGSAT